MADEATLMYVMEGDNVLLMMKKTGFGSGLYNGPGGKVEDDETVKEAAIRETIEEVNVKPLKIQKIGTVAFYFDRKLKHYVHVYRADDYKGMPAETKEGSPEWFNVEEMPWDQMWDDDRHWFQNVIRENTFSAKFYFDEETDELQQWEIEGVGNNA